MFAFDFETAGRIEEDAPIQVATFHLSNPVPTNPREFDVAHYLASILFFPPAGDAQPGGPPIVSLLGLAEQDYESGPQRWAAQQLKALLAQHMDDPALPLHNRTSEA
mgnify:FL=1